MSITKAKLLEYTRGRFMWVDIPGLGKVGVRTCPAIQLSRRGSSYRDATGNVIPEEADKAPIHSLIDQIMIDERTPMFTDDDYEALANSDEVRLRPFYDAIDKLNGGEAKNG